MSDLDFIPYSSQTIDDDDITAVAEALRSDYLTTGPRVDAFEAALAEAVDARSAVVVNSGTAALHLALMGAGCAEGQTWIVPAISFVATANAVRYCGGEVWFTDVDPDTGLMRPEDLEAAVAALRRSGRQASGVLPVDLGGQVWAPEALHRIAERHGLVVVEDAAHALGSTYGDTNRCETKVGACRHASMTIFSMHPVKTIAMGEGGAVTTNDSAVAERLRQLRSHGITRHAELFRNHALAFGKSGAANPWFYELHELGYNYRVPDFQCALGLSQLGKLARFKARRAELRAMYPSRLPQGASLVPMRDGQQPAWHLAIALIDFAALGKERAQVMAELAARRIGTQVHYIPIHEQPYYRERYGKITLPGAARYYARCLSLPLFPRMTDADLNRVAAALSEVFAA